MKPTVLSTVLAVWMGFLILVLPFTYVYGELYSVLFVQISALYLLSLLIYSRHFHPGDGQSRKFFRLSMIWLAALGLSVVFSVDISSSFYAYLKVVALVIVAGTMRYAWEDDVARPAFFLVAASGLLMHGGLAIGEYLEGGSIPPSWIDPGMRGIIKTRSAGVFGDPNLLGAYLTLLWPLALTGLARATSNSWGIAFWAGSLLVGGGGILVTLSRGAYLALLVGLVCLVVVRRPRLRRPAWGYSPKMAAVAVVTLLLALVFLTGPFWTRFYSMANSRDMTLSQRTLINRGLMRALPRAPLSGFGLHTFNLVYPRFRVVGGDYPLNAHNEFLQSWLETGPIGTIFLAALCWVLFWQGVHLWRKPPEAVDWLHAGSFSAGAVFFLQNLTGFSARVFPLAVLGACTVGGVLNSMKCGTAPAVNWFHLPRWRWPIRVLIFLYLFCVLHHAYIQFLFLDVRAAIGAGKWVQAETGLKSLERLAPRNPLVFYLYAQIDEAGGRPLNAAARLRTAAALNPWEALYLARLAELLEKGAEMQAAGEAWKAAIVLDPAAETFRLKYAEFLIRSGQFLEALSQLEVALTYSPGHHEVYPGFQFVVELKTRIESRLSPDERRQWESLRPSLPGVKPSL